MWVAETLPKRLGRGRKKTRHQRQAEVNRTLQTRQRQVNQNPGNKPDHTQGQNSSVLVYTNWHTQGIII